MSWLQQALHTAQQPPQRPRLPLLLGGQPIGSVEDALLAPLAAELAQAPERLQGRLERQDFAGLGPAWTLHSAQPSRSLNLLAEALRAAGRCGPWRNEQLAVCNPQGHRLATVERGAVRVLGVATQAVHLVAWAGDGRMWVQQRAWNKPNNPGMWDTLMGGMVAAEDTLAQAVERETWEEAGVRTGDLLQMQHGGHVDFACPSEEADGAGYMRERIDWFRAVLPPGLAPCNQDGEVAEFRCVDEATVLEWLGQGRFTLEASLVIAASLGLRA